MSDAENTPAMTFIAGQEHALVDPRKPQPARPSQRAETEAAVERLHARRGGNDEWSHADYLAAETLPDDDRPRFKDERGAYAHREEQRAEDEAAAERERVAEQAERVKAEQRQIDETTQWGDEAPIVEHVAERTRTFNTAAQQFMQMKANFDAKPDLQTPENRQYLAEVAHRLMAEQAELQKAHSTVHKAADLKNAHARRLALQRDIPALKDAETRKEFVKDMAKKHKVSPSYVESVQDEALVRKEFSAWEADRAEARQRHLDRPRKALYTAGPLAPGGRQGPEITVEQARDRLRQAGTMADAAQYLALRREREREARNG